MFQENAIPGTSNEGTNAPNLIAFDLSVLNHATFTKLCQVECQDCSSWLHYSKLQTFCTSINSNPCVCLFFFKTIFACFYFFILVPWPGLKWNKKSKLMFRAHRLRIKPPKAAQILLNFFRFMIYTIKTKKKYFTGVVFMINSQVLMTLGLQR